MSLTYQQLIDLAVEQSLRGMPENADGDLEMRAESFAPTALRILADKTASDPNQRHILIRNISVTLTNGVGTLPDTVMIEHLSNATLSNPSAVTEDYAYVPYWDDYRETVDRRLGYFIARGTTLDVTQPNTAYLAGSGLSGAVDLAASTAPIVPTAATDPILNLPAELEDDLVTLLSNLIRGGK